MKTQSSELIHKINNQMGLILSSLESVQSNMDDAKFCREVISEILKKKADINKTISEIKDALIEKSKRLSDV